MAKYFDFVLVRVEGIVLPRLAHAPRWSPISAGDEVIVEDAGGTCSKAVVLQKITLNEEDKAEIDFIMKATQTPTDGVFKVVFHVKYVPMDYEEDEE